MPILRGKENSLSRNLSEIEKQLGIDLKISEEGDLRLSNLNDFQLSFGTENAAQAVFLKLNIEVGGLVYHPAIGTTLQIGEKTSNSFEIKTQILRSLRQDPRFENININVTIVGNTTIVDGRLTIKGTGQSVPLQFVVVR